MLSHASRLMSVSDTSRLVRIGIIAGLIFLFIPPIVGIYGTYLWFASLGNEAVFTTILAYQAALFIGIALITYLVLMANYRWTTRRLRVSYGLWPRMIIAGSAVLLGITYAQLWDPILRFFNRQTFDITDPIFGLDIGFYIFTLPFLDILLSYAIVLIGASLIFSLTLYILHYGISTIEQVNPATGASVAMSSFSHTMLIRKLTHNAYAHIATLAALLLLVLGAHAYLARYATLTSDGTVFGVGYTQALITIPGLLIVTILAVIGALTILLTMHARRPRTLAIAFLIPLAAAGLVMLAGLIVQAAIVEPDELAKERSFLAYDIEHTRLAFGLDHVQEQPFEITNTLTPDDIAANEATIRNIRLWDWRPLHETYNELQRFRTYYSFLDVDVDRYRFDDDLVQVMVSAREIDFESLPARSQTWVNRHLVYTHGFGVTMSPVRDVSEEGLPEFLIKDIPPQSDYLTVDQPRLYYGENAERYAIVNTQTRELDYPAGDENVFTHYDGDGGVLLDSLGKRLTYAASFGAPQILLSGSITDESRIQLNRNIHERVRAIAPFLTYDSDPYIVTADGNLYWIYDAYTTTDRFPYAQRLAFKDGPINYIRNSVKVVIDAFSGETIFYVAEDEPIIAAYQQAFPDLFKSMDEMPQSLRAHVRYPEDIFMAQALMYREYHMRDPDVFYSREDAWEIPNEIFRGSHVRMEPYYIVMRLPGEEESEFVQILPFTPVGRENMIGWLAARSDQPNYGELRAYHFSKQSLIFGPMQIEARIDQDAHISQMITLWSQSGSRVIRGNLLVIPIEDSLLYVEPLFLQSRERGALPELRRVIVAYGDRVTMQESLEEAIAVLFGEREEETPLIPTEPGMLDDLRSAYAQAQEALRAGDFARYAEMIDRIGELLDEYS